MRVRRFTGMSLAEVREVLRDGWRECFALAMYLKMFTPSWPTGPGLRPVGSQMLLLVPTALIFLSSFAQAGADQRISFRLITVALIFAVCTAVSWLVATWTGVTGKRPMSFAPGRGFLQPLPATRFRILRVLNKIFLQIAVRPWVPSIFNFNI